MVFDNRLIFAENDFRLEYRGGVKDGHILNGQGTLTLRDGKTTFKGIWDDSISTEHETQIQGASQDWIKQIKTSEETNQQLFEANRLRILGEGVDYSREKGLVNAWFSFIKRFEPEKRAQQQAKGSPALTPEELEELGTRILGDF